MDTEFKKGISDNQVLKLIEERFFSFNYLTDANPNIKSPGELDQGFKTDLDITRQKSGLKNKSSILISEIRNYYLNHPHKWYYIKNQLGIPIWNYSREYIFEGNNLLFIPVANEFSSFVEAILVIFKDKDKKQLRHHYIKRVDLESYPIIKNNGNNKIPDKVFFLTQFIVFDKMIFDFEDCSLIKSWAIANSFINEDSKSYSICNIEYEEWQFCSWTCAGSVENPYMFCNETCYPFYIYYTTCIEMGGAPSDPNPPGGNEPPSNPGDTPEIITNDPSFLNTKADCIYDKLNNSGSVVKNLLSQYFGNSILDLTFKVNYGLPVNTNGRCVYASNTGVTIEINGNYMGTHTSIEVARTILHEACHAEIFGRIKKNGGMQYMNSSDDLTDEMISLYNSLYCNEYQHEFIADQYRDYITTGLEQVHPCLDSESVLNQVINSGITNLEDLYEALAWTGLRQTVSWNSKTGTEQQIIQNGLVNLSLMSKECNNEEIIIY